MSSKRKSTGIGAAGFTIIELLVTIAVIGILVPTIMTFVGTLTQLNDKTKDLTLINSLAENKVESLRSIGYTGVAVGTTDFTSELPDSISEPKSAQYTTTMPTPGIKQIDITISFGGHGENQTIKYRTMIGELGVGQY